MEKPIILCVDDEKSVLNGLRDELKFELGEKYSIEISESGKEALLVLDDVLQQGIEVPVVISDQLMPEMKGDEFLIQVHQRKPEIRKILLTGQATAEAVGNAVNKARLYRYIAKPWDAKDLVMTVEQAALSYMQELELEERLKILEELNTAVQEVSQEIHLHQLIDKLLSISLQLTGCTQGIFLLFEGTSLVSSFIKHGAQAPLQVLSLEDIIPQLPAEIISHIFRTREILILEKAFRHEMVKNNSFIQQNKIKFIFAAPLIKQTEIIGILFLYHTQKSIIVKPTRLHFFSVLLRQAAIAIDNALLYSSLEQRVLQRTQEIEEQKQIIEEKNKDIMDSLLYAQRMQISLLPDKNLLKTYFPRSFILYQPKDVVSGDFYWFTKVDRYFFLAAVDCTGHGVPGAFMSVLGSSQLNEIVNIEKILDTGLILKELDRKLLLHLQGKENQPPLQDGMELAICRIDLQEKKLQYSGANRPVVFIRNGQVEELTPDKVTIGFSLGKDNSQPFSFQIIEKGLQKGDTLYIFTDGFTDQFGGEKGKKLNKRSFIEILAALHLESPEDQEASLQTFIEEWKRDCVQTDDILVIGIVID
ncbi:MAG: SpoIIE family protein phosphatase [Bacteroidia bacterium]|nr:SpoIIE family protein phosphatase [Bacteroidia bacterium]MDW8158038.1 SpoIIE family protein phosphatase [Bacteroidia bacterium]